jgi:catechol 2,3-dioxygenase-like lactoylglutathione lyase family enzyme
LEGSPHFYVLDPFGHIFEVVESEEFFSHTRSPIGGVVGAGIGVSDMDRALSFYRGVLGYDQVRADDTGVFADLQALPGGEKELRRVTLTHSERRAGPFSRLFGASTIELIQQTSGVPRKIYQDRFWGDVGFIHLCFDVVGMDALKEQCAALGHPFVVDSNDTFDMGEASGRFSYVEDPDGTLIEFVETHKIPIAKKMGFYLDLRKRNRAQPLSNWMLKMMRFARVKD